MATFFGGAIQVWCTPAALSAFLSTGLISLVPNLLLFLFPALFTTTTTKDNNNNQHMSVWWQWGQALAAGGLMGDVFLHTLPHALEGGEGHEHHHDKHDHEHDHEHHSHHEDPTGIWILLGFLVFLTVDVLLRVTEDLLHKKNDNDHSASCKENGTTGHDHSHIHQKAAMNGAAHDETKSNTTTTATTHQDPSSGAAKAWSLLVLNLTADSLHNFTDGLAIGTSYAAAAASASSSVSLSSIHPGSVATLSILLHEVPHELGDYCTLVAAGYTPWQAVRTQFITAVAAFIGTAVALLVTTTTTTNYVHDDDETSQLFDSHHDNHHHHHPHDHKSMLLLGTAGGFLYLAATTLLPHVLQEPVQRPWKRLGHLVAFVVGLGFMFAVAVLEEQEEHEGGAAHHHGDQAAHHVEL